MRESPYPMVSVEDALAIILRQTAPLPAVLTPLQDALGLVLAEDVVATQPQPPFPAATVDGFALRTADGLGQRRLVGEQMAGHAATLTVEPGTAVRITTGAPVPPGADAVARVEGIDEANGWVSVRPGERLAPGVGIRPVGSDVAAGALVLVGGTPLGPTELGMVASLGHAQVAVHRRPVVGVFSTGDELAQPGEVRRAAQIYDSNRPTLLAAVARAGGRPLDLGVVGDRLDDLEQVVARGLAVADVLVTSGGVSMGELDLLKPLLERWGQVHFGRVRMKPGKPFTFATVPARRATGEPDWQQPARLVFALPGNPVSALVAFQLFVRPALRRLLGFERVSLPQIAAVLGHDVQLDPERPEYHRVTLHRNGQRFVAVSTGSQASSRLLSATGAHGLLVLEQGEGVLSAGSERPVLLLDDEWLRA